MSASSAAAYQSDLVTRPINRQDSSRAFNQYVRVQMPRSGWSEKLSRRLNDLTSLPRGWDGYFAPPVSFTNAAFAAALIERIASPDIEAPQVVPGSDGRLQIEWHSGGYDIELEVLAPYRVVASREHIESGQVDEEVLESDFSTLMHWLSDLSAAKARQ